MSLNITKSLLQHNWNIAKTGMKYYKCNYGGHFHIAAKFLQSSCKISATLLQDVIFHLQYVCNLEAILNADSGKSTSAKEITYSLFFKDEYFKKGPHNIISVDWEQLAAGNYFSYYFKTGNVKPVGKCLVQLIQKLRESNVEDIHAIGFSLGAQVLASTARYLHPYKIDRITGLDPAGPGFFIGSKNEHLDKSDAHFVDVIHTNNIFRGQVETCGHVDFYMNGGFNQPGCQKVGCSHQRALEYFTESINSEIGFWGWPCESLWKYLIGSGPAPKMCHVQAGNPANRTLEGLYLVKTNSQSPFAKGRNPTAR